MFIDVNGCVKRDCVDEFDDMYGFVAWDVVQGKFQEIEIKKKKKKRLK
jgi:hypothetical protein